MERLFVYGTLRPGHSNAYILENIGGEWLPGYVTGTFYERGWGAAADFPGIVLHKNGPQVQGYLFTSDNLEAHWPCWMNLKMATIALRLTSSPQMASRSAHGFISYNRKRSRKRCECNASPV
jgi:gamma-glutamylcyclotransferase (GGCT)/AIG2-like uncharacterized protein YtfP